MLSPRKLGRYNEQRVKYAIETLKPWWYMEGRWAYYYEDRCGIDLWIRHKIMGWVPFQVKSSKRGFRSHTSQANKKVREGGSIIPCVISNPDRTLSDIVGQVDRGFRFERLHGFFAQKVKALRRLKR
jgi:hypothetical protein